MSEIFLNSNVTVNIYSKQLNVLNVIISMKCSINIYI